MDSRLFTIYQGALTKNTEHSTHFRGKKTKYKTEIINDIIKAPQLSDSDLWNIKLAKKRTENLKMSKFAFLSNFKNSLNMNDIVAFQDFLLRIYKIYKKQNS